MITAITDWFFFDDITNITTISYTYNMWYVLLSYGVAVFASLAAFHLLDRVNEALKRVSQIIWLLTGGASLGLGVWAMHFIAMQAVNMPSLVRYNLPLTILSAFVVIIASTIALQIIAKRPGQKRWLALGGTILGAGIGTMHYLGMGAMQMNALIRYEPSLFILSIISAIILSIFSLWLLSKRNFAVKKLAKSAYKTLSAGIMGAAVTAMHYMGMAATYFIPSSKQLITGIYFDTVVIVFATGVVSILLIALSLLASIVDKSLQAKDIKVLESERVLNAVINNIGECIISMDTNGTIKSFNPRAQQVFGYHESEMLGEKIELLIPQEHRTGHQLNLDNLQLTAPRIMGKNRQIQGVRKNNTVFPLKIKITPMNVLGESMFVALCDDISEQISREEELKKANEELSDHRDNLQYLVEIATKELNLKAIELTKALDKERELNSLQKEFVSMVSHEFRTPLAIIDSTAQRLLRHKESITVDTLDKKIPKIRNSVERMTNLIESTLTVAKLDAGKLQISPERCSIRNLVSSVCARHRSLSKTHSIALNIEKLPPIIWGDPSALDQVLTNLMSNAIKYSNDKLNIKVTGWQEDDDFIGISVQDYGIGINEEDQRNMFERFFRAATSRGIPGTGIGLNLAKHLIEMHNGTIELKSIEGEGSTFTVRLPIAAPDQNIAKNSITNLEPSTITSVL